MALKKKSDRCVGNFRHQVFNKDSILIDMGIVKKENKVYGDINKKNIEKKFLI